MKRAEDLTLGAASLIEIDDDDIGYTSGDVTFDRSAEVKKFFYGLPRKTILQVPIDDQLSTTFQLAQVTAKNLAIAALNLPYSADTSGAGTATAQTRTFVAPSSSSLERCYLDGPGTTYAISAVTNVAGDVTYDNYDDYILDAKSGMVTRNPGGTIPSGGSIKITYTFAKLAYEELAFGRAIPIVERKFKFQHITPKGAIHEVVLWKCQAAASFTLAYKSEDWGEIPVTLEALDDSVNHPNTPYGYFRVTQPA